VKLFLI